MKINGQLEIDEKRGVIYFHTDDKRAINKFGTLTILRICQLPTPIPHRALDITHMVGCDWSLE
jgi:hypothetical protein